MDLLWKDDIKLQAKLFLGYGKRVKYNNPRILHNHKSIFVHIPKTAGNSITSILTELSKSDMGFSPKIAKHAKAFEVKALLGGKIWDQYFTFAMVRNPWDLMVSSYHWWQQKAKGIPYHSNHALKVGKMKDLNEFLNSRYGQEQINERRGNIFDWITDRNGNIIIDFIGKAESLDKDWLYICEQIGIEHHPIPHINKSQRRDYQEYYTDQTKDLVYRRFKKTIDRFGYEF